MMMHRVRCVRWMIAHFCPKSRDVCQATAKDVLCEFIMIVVVHCGEQFVWVQDWNVDNSGVDFAIFRHCTACPNGVVESRLRQLAFQIPPCVILVKTTPTQFANCDQVRMGDAVSHGGFCVLGSFCSWQVPPQNIPYQQRSKLAVCGTVRTRCWCALFGCRGCRKFIFFHSHSLPVPTT